MPQILLAAMPLIAMTNIKQFQLYKGKKGKFIRGFLLNDKRNKNGWRTTWQAILDGYLDYINKPGTYYTKGGKPEHPDGKKYKEMLVNQENYRVVNIIDLILDHENHSLDYVGEELPFELSEIKFDMSKVNYTSPGVFPIEYDVVGTMPNGMPMLDVTKFRALHIAYITDPAYPKEDAKTVATCEGMGESCMTRLAASTEDNLSHLQEVPIVKETLNTLYTPCQLKAFHATIAASESSCVSRKLRIIMDENPSMEKDQQLAIAYSYCSKEGRAQLAQDLSEKKQVRIMTAAVSLKFKPRPDEQPDADGNYWRTIMGQKIPFKKGEDMTQKLRDAGAKWREEQKNKPKPKPKPEPKPEPKSEPLTKLSDKHKAQVDALAKELNAIPGGLNPKEYEKYRKMAESYRETAPAFTEAVLNAIKPPKIATSFDGWEGNQKFKFSGKVQEEYANQLKEAWNSTPKEMRDRVETVKVRQSTAKYSAIAGEWIEDKKTVILVAHRAWSKETYVSFAHHELAHAQWHSYTPEQRKAWIDETSKINGVERATPYTEAKFAEYRTYQKALDNAKRQLEILDEKEKKAGRLYNNTRREIEKDIPIYEHNAKGFHELFYNELHSEVYAWSIQEREKGMFTSDKARAEATKIFERMFAK